jgi:N,N'-diacetyllegionaminate synthase
MKISDFDTDKKVLIVAEIGNNHEGSYSLAEEMIVSAAEAGADAVKFQTIRAAHLVSRSDQRRLEQLKAFELSSDVFSRLKRVADKAEIIYISTPFDLGVVDFLSPLVAAFKISSGDNTFYPLIERVAETGKPIIMSCGLAGLPQLQYVRALIDKVWYDTGAGVEMAVLHCVTAYPVPRKDANLALIRVLQDELGCTVGYSDHTLGIDAAVASVAAGARIVEKHFTLNKHQSDYRDHQLSADPDDLALMVQKIREVEELLGPGEKRLLSCEQNLVLPVRRSIVAARDLKVGEAVVWEDISWTRPAGGLQPGQEHLVLGRTLVRNIVQGHRIMSEDVK